MDQFPDPKTLLARIHRAIITARLRRISLNEIERACTIIQAGRMESHSVSK